MKFKIIFIVLILVVGVLVFGKKAFAPNMDSQNQIDTSNTLFDEFGSYEYKEGNMTISAQVPFFENGQLVSDIAAYVSDYIENFKKEMNQTDTSSSPFPSNLVFDFKMYESDAIVSYVVQGYEFTGGAHGNTFFKSFNYETSSGRKIDVLDIVTSPDHLWTFAALLDKAAVVQYPEGASGDNPENWDIWYADNGSVTFIFPPYQIASYANGVQEFNMVAVGDNATMFEQKYFK